VPAPPCQIVPMTERPGWLACSVHEVAWRPGEKERKTCPVYRAWWSEEMLATKGGEKMIELGTIAMHHSLEEAGKQLAQAILNGEETCARLKNATAKIAELERDNALLKSIPQLAIEKVLAKKKKRAACRGRT